MQKIYFLALISFTIFLASCGGSKQTATQTTTVDVGSNSAPVITALTATPDTVQIKDSISLSCQASDADNDPLAYSWSAAVGSFTSKTGSATTWTAPGTAGNYTISCTVSDGTTTVSSQVSVTVTPLSGENNSPNILSGPTAEKNPALTGEAVGISVQADDPDGDVLTYTWNASAGSISGTGAAVTFTAPSSAQDVTITVTVEDGRGGSASGSLVVTVNAPANNPPTISSLACDNTTLLTTASTTCTVTATDADGDSLSYAWSADLGTISGSGSSATYTAPATAGTATVAVQVSDGKDTATTSTTLTITTLTVSGKVVLDGGDAHTCVINGGRVYCWGKNSSGQLGDGTTTDSQIPVLVKSITNAVELSLGGNKSCALLSTGEVWCWGSGYGSSPQVVAGLTDQGSSVYVQPVSNGRVCSVLSSGEVLCISSGSTSSEGTGVKRTVSSCHLMADGTVQSVQGDTSCDGAASLSSVQFLTRGILSINYNNYNFFCALLSNGTVQCWGNNSYGQLGDTSTIASTTPVTVAKDSVGTPLQNVVAISSKSTHTCAILADGSVYCWGRNSDGQLGNGVSGDSFSSPFAVQVKNLPAAAKAVGVGYSHSCAVLVDGSVYCWGSNTSGQLGNGTTTSSPTPVKVFQLTVAQRAPLGMFASWVNRLRSWLGKLFHDRA